MMPEDNIDAKPMSRLPPYRIRTSRRARRARVRVTPWAEVEVVLPLGFDPAQVPHFLLQHHQWLNRTLARVIQRRGVNQSSDKLPQAAHLAALNENWRIRYRDKAPQRKCLYEADRAANEITLASRDKVQVRQALHNWLTQRAKDTMLPWLHALSRELGLAFTRASIRCQKTRWGSCSARHNINLNRNLLFLSDDAVRYLMVHELCHTVHLNHSAHFWELVATIEPRYREWEAQLRDADRHVPLWALPRDA